jgi:hypothetical protein
MKTQAGMVIVFDSGQLSLDPLADLGCNGRNAALRDSQALCELGLGVLHAGEIVIDLQVPQRCKLPCWSVTRHGTGLRGAKNFVQFRIRTERDQATCSYFVHITITYVNEQRRKPSRGRRLRWPPTTQLFFLRENGMD